MFVTTFRYRILPAKLRQFLELQQQAEGLYLSEPGHRVMYLRSTSDRCQWLELHFFVDESAHNASVERWSADPRMEALWTGFRQTLDPAHQNVVEEYRRYRHGEGDQPAGAMDV